MGNLNKRVGNLEARQAARQDTAHVLTLEAWRAECAEHRGESVDAWLARMLSDANMAKWPEQDRARMAKQYGETAETLQLMERGEI